MENTKELDVVGKIIDFESGELDNQGILELFSELIKTGLAWSLQGCYGRLATELINQGLIDNQGNLTGKGIIQ